MKNYEKELRSTGLLLIRLMIGIVFIYHGGQKLFGIFGGYGIEGTAGFFAQLGIPFPTLSVYLAGGAEFFGGILLILGLLVRPTSLILAVTMLVASFSAHSGFGIQTGGMEYSLTLAVVSIALVLIGAGDFALDRYVFRKKAAALETGRGLSDQLA